MSELGYLMLKCESNPNIFYDDFLYAAKQENAKIFLPHEVKDGNKHKDTNPGKIVPVMWEWKDGKRKLMENTI